MFPQVYKLKLLAKNSNMRSLGGTLPVITALTFINVSFAA
jgi:hypothetical protein